MPRRRMIDPNIWQSEDFSKLSTLAKLIFIGLFSNADDEGRGRAKPVYIKSILFPYDEKVRVIDIETALSEIGLNLSVTFYSSNGSQYYALDHWKKWQSIDKPKASELPAPQEVEEIRVPVADESPTSRRRVGDESGLNRKEEEREEKGNRKETKKGPLAAALADFSEMRRKIKAPLTDRAKELILSELEKLAPDEEELQIKILEQSTQRGWRGVFPLRESAVPGKPFQYDDSYEEGTSF